MGVVADGLLQQRKAGVEPAAEDREFDEAFLQERVLLANHSVASPNCLDRGVLHWERQFYHSVPWELKRKELCDAAERITLAAARRAGEGVAGNHTNRRRDGPGRSSSPI